MLRQVATLAAAAVLASASTASAVVLPGANGTVAGWVSVETGRQVRLATRAVPVVSETAIGEVVTSKPGPLRSVALRTERTPGPTGKPLAGYFSIELQGCPGEVVGVLVINPGCAGGGYEVFATYNGQQCSEMRFVSVIELATTTLAHVETAPVPKVPGELLFEPEKWLECHAIASKPKHNHHKKKH